MPSADLCALTDRGQPFTWDIHHSRSSAMCHQKDEKYIQSSAVLIPPSARFGKNMRWMSNGQCPEDPRVPSTGQWHL